MQHFPSQRSLLADTSCLELCIFVHLYCRYFDSRSLFSLINLDAQCNVLADSGCNFECIFCNISASKTL